MAAHGPHVAGSASGTDTWQEATRVHADAREGPHGEWRGRHLEGPRVSGPWLEVWGSNAPANTRMQGEHPILIERTTTQSSLDDSMEKDQEPRSMRKRGSIVYQSWLNCRKIRSHDHLQVMGHDYRAIVAINSTSPPDQTA